ncbi:hypothetical protein JCGZ_24402 [Jatropha curcas]|uniref:Aminotransferase class V domain-containing protein n=1 Tax=Jatropha curcas TaxID=180498 RepID=A0A067L5Y7_JATCU|nr:hypothetical protein JCGZ_24402 [Jatropha curcas]
MELEQPIPRNTPNVQKLSSFSLETTNTYTSRSTTSSKTTSHSTSYNDLCNRSESFRTLEMGIPKDVSPEKRLAWLRSQIVGNGVEFDSPFGKRTLTYADHTASGKSLHYIENFIIDNVLPFYGGGLDDAIIFCGSGTTAAIKRLQETMCIAVPSIMRDRLIKCLTNEERWVVFVGPYEHHSNFLSWRQSLAEVIEIGADDDGLIDMEALEERLSVYRNANRPILGSFSACSNVTGICSDTRGIAQLIHKYGGFVCFDFAANGPYTEIDMRSGEMDGYDAIFLSPHKFLGGPGSPGILLMKAKGEEDLYMWAETGNKRDKPLHGAFVAALLNDLFGIQSRGGCACAGPYGHFLLNINQTTSLAIRSAIQKGYVGGKPGCTRISFAYYMSEEEFEFILAAVEFIAIYGQRFLPLYHFNWKNGNWTFKKKTFKDLLLACGGRIVNKHTSYLEMAKNIANLLPKFPSQRKLPEDLDHNLLYFRV